LRAGSIPERRTFPASNPSIMVPSVGMKLKVQ